MSYVDEVYERVVAQNPGEPEFHQAVKEVLDSQRRLQNRAQKPQRKPLPLRELRPGGRRSL